MRKLDKKTIIGVVAAAAVVVVGLVIFLRPKHFEEVLPIVGVDTVRTRNVEVYGEFPGKSVPSSSWKSGQGWKAILKNDVRRGNLRKERPDTLYH